MIIELSTKCPIDGTTLILNVEGRGEGLEHFVTCPREIAGITHQAASVQARNMYTLVIETLDASDEIHAMAYEEAHSGR